MSNMREILFRGKRIDSGKWVEGAFCPKNCDTICGPMIDKPSIIKLEPPLDGFWYDVDPETVGQFTGLTDKNSQKIFEGDIVQINEHGTAVNGLYCVQWYEINSCWALHRNEKHHHHYFTFSELNGFAETSEIVGNIYDNPELLEGE